MKCLLNSTTRVYYFIKKIFLTRYWLNLTFIHIRIYQAVQKLPDLLQTLSNSDNTTLNNIITTTLKEFSNDMSNYQSMIEETIDFNLVERGEFLIQSGFDNDLQEMRNQMNEYESKIKSNLTKTSEALGISVKLDSNSQYGFFFKVSLKVITLIFYIILNILNI